MRFETYLLLTEKARFCPQIAADLQQFSQEMAEQKRHDQLGVMHLEAAVGAPELAAIVRPQENNGLSREQREHNMQCALQLYRRLSAGGMHVHDVLWVVNSWMNALAWPFSLYGDAYDAEVSALTEAEREVLAAQNDGYAAASLAADCEQRGDIVNALRWRQKAYDSCDIKTLRWMQRTADESGMPMEMRRAQAMRHAALGDPEGLAAYALYLLETGDEESAEEKAFRLASLSAQMDSAAGHYAMYRCLSNVSYLHRVYDCEVHGDEQGAQELAYRANADAAWQLEMAIRGGYPRAYLARALEYDARGEYGAAYAELVQSIQDGPLYAGISDGAYLLAQYCLEGKGTQRSEKQALAWAQLGVARGCKLCTELEERLGRQGATEADELSEKPAQALQSELVEQIIAKPEEDEEEKSLDKPAMQHAEQQRSDEKAAFVQEEPQSDTPGAVYTILCSLMNQVNRESIDLDGRDASDSMLVDTYLAGLCSAMLMHEAVEAQDRAYYDGIYDLCDFSPEFGRKGYHEEYLHERFAAVFAAMGGYRQEYAALFESEGRVYADAWAWKRDLECAVVYEIIEQLLSPDEQAQTNLKAAILHMLDALKAAHQAC